MNLENWQSQLRKGLLDIVALNMLRRGASHGYEMVQTLKRLEGLQIREGNIYPVLARLEQDGLVTSYSEPSSGGPPRKYFKLTSAGEEALAEMNGRWERLMGSIEQVRKGGDL